jgi:hypothetical protein
MTWLARHGPSRGARRGGSATRPTSRDQRRDHVAGGHPHRNRGGRPDQLRKTGGQEQPQESPEGAEEGGLDQELHQDLATPRPHRLPQPDLEGALVDAHEHDVHDHDAAHHQGDQGDGSHDHRDPSRELVDVAVHLVHVHETEVVVVAIAQAMPAAHLSARLFDRRRQQLPTGGQAVDLDAVAAAEDPSPGGEGDVDDVVERLAEHGPARRLHPHDAHGQALDGQGLAQGVRGREEPLPDVHADHAHERGMVDLVGKDEASLGDRLVLDRGHARRHPGDPGRSSVLRTWSIPVSACAPRPGTAAAPDVA